MVLIVVLSLGFSLLFATALRGGFRTAILAPLIQGFYLVRFYVLRLPQQLLWAASLLVGGGVLVRVAARALGPPAKRPTKPRAGVGTVDELERLAVAIEAAPHRPFYRAQVRNELVGIAARLIARQEHLCLSEAQARLKAGSWGNDPVVEAFFRTDKTRRRRPQRAIHFDEQLRHTLHVLERYRQGG